MQGRGSAKFLLHVYVRMHFARYRVCPLNRINAVIGISAVEHPVVKERVQFKAGSRLQLIPEVFAAPVVVAGALQRCPYANPEKGIAHVRAQVVRDHCPLVVHMGTVRQVVRYA